MKKCKKCGTEKSWFEWLINYPCECEINARMLFNKIENIGKEKK